MARDCPLRRGFKSPNTRGYGGNRGGFGGTRLVYTIHDDDESECVWTGNNCNVGFRGLGKCC